MMLLGVMSFTYHVCPNSLYLPIDTTPMYVISTLYVSKVYRLLNSHHDHLPKGLLCATVTTILINALPPISHMKTVYSAVTIIAAPVIVFTIYESESWTNLDLSRTQWSGIPGIILNEVRAKWSAGFGSKEVAEFSTVILLLLWSLIGGINWNLQDLDQVSSLPFFAVSSLAILALPITCHLYSQIEFNWKPIQLIVQVCVVASISFYIAALVFYNDKTSDFGLPEAESRSLNKPCFSSLLIFDAHDLWHMLSSLAIFLSLFSLVLMEDAISLTSH